MKKTVSILIGLAMLATLFAMPLSGMAEESAALGLKSITFKNATLDTEFNPDVLVYTITLENNTETPTLESFELLDADGDAELFITYTADKDTGHQTGIQAKLESSDGSAVQYAFNYSNPPEFEPNDNCYLMDIYGNYAELDSEMTHDRDTYRLYIPKDLTVLKITPVTEDVNASCPEVEIKLSDEKTTLYTLPCKASDGTEREYTIKIKRVNKTLEQVKEEMQADDYVSFVTGTHFYENTSFYVVAGSIVGGIIVLFALYIIIKRYAVNPYDPDEKPFYSI